MSLQRIGLIGFGAIGRGIVEAWSCAPVEGAELTGVLVRPHQVEAARTMLPHGVLATADIGELLARAPEVVVEAAGHGAVHEHAERVLSIGARFMLLSIGALADAALQARLDAAARAGGTRLVLPVGAFAGFDGLLALRRAGLHRVRYTSTKPPRAWRGTPAEHAVDLDALVVRTMIFDGSAREAARLYPKNANIAAAVALAGLGFEATSVQLFADPQAEGNTGRVEAEGESSRLEVTVSGRSSAANPKTSAITGMSVLAALTNAASTVSFG